MSVETEERNTTKKDILVRGVFFVTLVLVLAFGAWGGVTAVKYLPETMSGIFDNVSGNITAAVIDISSRFIPASGVPEEGTLVVVDDQEDATFLADELGADDAETSRTLEDTRSASVSDSETPTDGTVRTPGEATSATVPLASTPVVEDPNGIPDLSVTVTAVGILDATTNDFTEQDSMKTTDRGAVSFTVTNSGTKTVAAGWTFSATLPTSPAHVYASDPQQSLAPGDRIEFTLGFDSVLANADGDAVVTIILDPDTKIVETSETNNTAHATIKVSS